MMTERIFSAEEKLECVRREIKLRQRVYPYRVAQGKMTQQLADEQLALMAAVEQDMERLAQSQRLI